VLHGGPIDADEVARVRETVIFAQPNLQTKLVRFFVLLALASTIATFGLLSDSVAAVIGAMIIAPLMLPIMGLAFGISVGDRKAVWSSLLVAAGGIATAILMGYLARLVTPSNFNPDAVGQIISRTTPGILDLLMAIAVGLVGAFAMGRNDVSDTLPGVAIAVSLVPPLANAGILFSTGHPTLARGSLLLFATNLVAIVLTGALVFGLMGYPRVAFVGRTKASRRIALAVVFVLTFVVAVPLFFTSLLVWVQHTAVLNAAVAVEDWLEGSSWEFVDSVSQNDRVDIVIAGSGELPDEAVLAESLRGQVFGLPVHVEAIDANIFVVQTE
jgi:uncharacterized hydrophobic protein (TIGR00271 family)